MCRILAVFLLSLFAGCSANLDAECTDFFERVNEVLGEIAAARNIDELEARVDKLNKFSREVKSLQARARERLGDKIATGKICSELTPPGVECDETLVFDELNKRKTVALTGFMLLLREVGTMPAVGAGFDLGFYEGSGSSRPDQGELVFNRLNSKILDEISMLSYVCNNTLR